MDTIENNFKDIDLICKDCGEKFPFTANEQKFYASQGFVNVPARCKKCREEFQKKKYKGAEVYNVKCVKCGLVGKITVPIPYPKNVFCETCFTEELAKEKQTKGSLPKTIYDAMRVLGQEVNQPVLVKPDSS